jgi:FixJ family two-component response regulator
MKAGAHDFLEKPLNHLILLDSVNQAFRITHLPHADMNEFNRYPLESKK